METKSNTGDVFNKIILIPTDFSPKCDNAVLQGIQLAEKLHYKVIILHVIDKQNEAILKNAEQGQDCIGLNFHKYKTEFGGKSNVEIETVVRHGSIVSEILALANELKSHLLIFGTDGKHGLEYLFGSHALKLVLHSPCPVIVVQNKLFELPYQNIVLPVKSDIDPRQAVASTLTFSQVFNSKVRLFLSHETDISLKNRNRVISNQIAGELKNNQIQYTIEEAEGSGDFALQVISYANVTKSDLIIIVTGTIGDSFGFNLAGWNEKIMFNQDQLAVMCVNPVTVGKSEIDWL
jgi:universal stress protein A